MVINVNYSTAYKMFLNHLKDSKVKNHIIISFKITLQGAFKRYIAGELKSYRLSMPNSEKLHSINKGCYYKYYYGLNTFNKFINKNVEAQNLSFNKNLTVLKRELNHLSDATKNNITDAVLKLVTYDIDDLPVSDIPEKIINECMKPGTRQLLVRARRFFKFLIQINLLNKKYLPHGPSKLINNIKNVTIIINKTITLQQALFIYLKNKSENSYLIYETIKTTYHSLKNFVRFIGSKHYLTTVNREDIINYLNYLQVEKKYSVNSKSAFLTQVKALFSYFLDMKIITANPVENIKIKRNYKVEKDCLTENELTKIFTESYLIYKNYEEQKSIDSRIHLKKWLAARNWAIISLLITTGIRRKELLTLLTSSIDFKNRTIFIKGKGDFNYHIREREIPLTEPIALTALETYLRLRPDSIFPNLFLNCKSEPLKPDSYNNILKEIKDKILTRKSLSITRIRKSFASLCADKGIDPLVLKQIMGHNSLATTMKYYLSVQDQQLKEVWENNNPLLYFKEKEWCKWII